MRILILRKMLNTLAGVHCERYRLVQQSRHISVKTDVYAKLLEGPGGSMLMTRQLAWSSLIAI